MSDYIPAVALLAFAPLLALRMHHLRIAGGPSMARHWRLAALLSAGLLVFGGALLFARHVA